MGVRGHFSKHFPPSHLEQDGCEEGRHLEGQSDLTHGHFHFNLDRDGDARESWSRAKGMESKDLDASFPQTSELTPQLTNPWCGRHLSCLGVLSRLYRSPYCFIIPLISFGSSSLASCS